MNIVGDSDHENLLRTEECQQKLADLERQAQADAALKAFRQKLQRGDAVHVPKKIIRVDHKRNVAVVSLGLGQWEVTLEEVFPVRPPNVG